MKNIILQFVLAIFSPLLITLPTLYFFRQIEMFSFISIFIHIILTVWLSFKLSNIFAKIVLWIMSLLSLFILIVFFIESLGPLLPKQTITEYVEVQPFDSAESSITESAIMRSNKLTLYEKFVNISFSTLIENKLLTFSFSNAHPDSICNSINSLVLDNELLMIDTVIPDSIDSIQINLKDGTILNLNSYKKDEENYNKLLGYLPNNEFFICQESCSEASITYSSINLQNGQEFQGIPLFNNSTRTYYANVYFKDIIGDLYLIIKTWERNDDEFVTLYYKEIPLYNYERDEELNYQISNIEWIADNILVFYFSELSGEKESVQVKMKILKSK